MYAADQGMKLIVQIFTIHSSVLCCNAHGVVSAPHFPLTSYQTATPLQTFTLHHVSDNNYFIQSSFSSFLHPPSSPDSPAPLFLPQPHLWQLLFIHPASSNAYATTAFRSVSHGVYLRATRSHDVSATCTERNADCMFRVRLAPGYAVVLHSHDRRLLSIDRKSGHPCLVERSANKKPTIRETFITIGKEVRRKNHSNLIGCGLVGYHGMFLLHQGNYRLICSADNEGRDGWTLNFEPDGTVSLGKNKRVVMFRDKDRSRLKLKFTFEQRVRFRVAYRFVKRGLDHDLTFLLAKDSLTRFAQSPPACEEEWMTLAHALKRCGKFVEAAACHQAIRKEKPYDPQPLVDIADCLKEAGDASTASRYCSAALRQDPDFVPAYILRGEVLQDTRDLDRALELDPSNGRAFQVRGELHLAKNNTKQALQDFKASIDLDGDTTGKCFFQYASLLWKVGRRDDAEDTVTAGLEKFPDFAPLHLRQGVMLQEFQRLAQALKWVNKAVRLDPFYAASYHVRRALHASVGNHTDAMADGTTAMFLTPTFYAFRSGRKTVHKGEAERDEVYTEIETLLENSEEGRVEEENPWRAFEVWELPQRVV